MGANELSASLWRERNLFEILEYKLEVEHLLLTAGNSKWIGRVTDEIDEVVGALRKLNLIRDLEIERLAEEWDISGRASLREIVQAAPDAVWGDIFAAHLGALLDLAGRIRTLRDANSHLLRSAIRSTQETISSLDATLSTYDSRGHSGFQPAAAQLIDKDI